jgi:hypothetical protein
MSPLVLVQSCRKSENEAMDILSLPHSAGHSFVWWYNSEIIRVDKPTRNVVAEIERQPKVQISFFSLASAVTSSCLFQIANRTTKDFSIISC